MRKMSLAIVILSVVSLLAADFASAVARLPELHHRW